MLTFEEWLKLSIKERGERYKDLSNEDKYRARVCGYYFEQIGRESDKPLEIPEFLKDVEIKSDSQSDNIKFISNWVFKKD